jgi:hypothetical protein
MGGQLDSACAQPRLGDLLHELLTNAVLQQFFGIELNDAHERSLHGEDALGEHRHLAVAVRVASERKL